MHRFLICFLLVFLMSFTPGCGSIPAGRLPEADKILVVKSAHTLTLMRGDQILRTTRSRLAGTRLAQNFARVITRHPKGNTRLTGERNTAGSIGHCIFHIQTLRTENERKRVAMILEAM